MSDIIEKTHQVEIELDQAKKITFSNNLPIVLIAGPCVIESRSHALEMAHALSEITYDLKLPFVYKSSFDKANRLNIASYRGIGIKKSISIFADIKESFDCPILTDVHTADQCMVFSEVVDILQIPAFLCRQTDLIVAAAKTGKTLNVKKGQFLAPQDIFNIVSKIESTKNKNILLCERGASFGYNNLVSDMRSLPIMKSSGYPVIFDATHSVQLPGGKGNTSGGQRQFVEVLSRAAVAVGVSGIFIETHQNPDKALCDGPNMIHLKDIKNLLKNLMEFDNISKRLMEKE